MKTLSNTPTILNKYSFGIGDRFGQQGKAQLKAIIMAKRDGIDITPVWNKSFREHAIVRSNPSDTRTEADEAVSALEWDGEYYVDADHINLSNVDQFINSSNFFTIDVAEYIGKPADEIDIKIFTKKNKKYTGDLYIPGIEQPFFISNKILHETALKFLLAVKEAGKIFNHITEKKGNRNFIAEISMDEVDQPQTPAELFFILSAVSMFGIPAQTIAPKFTGRFNKGVDYVGDVDQFAKEFEEDLLVFDFAIKEFGLPENLKLSIHSGSDKFSIYPVIGNLIRKYDKGLHIKTAGTTWLEELIGLCLSGDESLQLAKSIYRKGFERANELCAPYSTVIDIDQTKLPDPSDVDNWNGEKFANSLRHIPGHLNYNPNLRQLLHVSYKIAAEYGQEYIDLIKKNSETVGKQVIENIYNRHILKLFT
jgi:hypothetical protein